MFSSRCFSYSHNDGAVGGVGHILSRGADVLASVFERLQVFALGGSEAHVLLA